MRLYLYLEELVETKFLNGHKCINDTQCLDVRRQWRGLLLGYCF